MENFFDYNSEEERKERIKNKNISALVLSIFIVILCGILLTVNIIMSIPAAGEYRSAGNNYGNISSGGYACANGNIVYFSNANDNYSIWAQNTSTGVLTKLNSSQSWYITYYDGWIYYSNYDDGYSIHKLRADGSEDIKLNSSKSLYLNVSGGWIYYTDSSGGGYINKMNTDGGEVTRLNHTKSVYLCVYDNWIYFSNSSNMSYLYKIRTDGTDETLVISADSRYINIHDGYLYYLCYEDSERSFSNIYRIRLDGRKNAKVSDEYCESIIVYGDYIYYVSADKGHIGKMKTDGSGVQTVYELGNDCFGIVFMSICGDKIYYCADGMDKNYSFCVNTDGSGNILLAAE